MKNSLKLADAELKELEIFFKIFQLIQEYWIIITICTLLGIAGAFLKIYITPKQYTANALVKTTQITNKLNMILMPEMSNIESFQTLLTRLDMNTTYPNEIFALCSSSDARRGDLLKKLKVTEISEKDGIMQLSITDSSKEIIKVCINAIYEFIKESQANIIVTYSIYLNSQLDYLKERLNLMKVELEKLNQSKGSGDIFYFLYLKEIGDLQKEISNIEKAISYNKILGAPKISEIDFQDFTIANTSKIILIWSFLGFGIGLLLSGIHRRFKRSVNTFRPGEL